MVNPAVLLLEKYSTTSKVVIQPSTGANFEYPAHRHNFIELVVIFHGRGLHHVDGNTIPIQSGDVYVLTENQIHAYENVHDISSVNVLFNPDVLLPYNDALLTLPGYHALFRLEPQTRSQYQGDAGLRLTSSQQLEITTQLNQMGYEQMTCPPGWQTMLEIDLVRLIILLSRYYASAEKNSTPFRLLQLGHAISFMEDNYQNQLTLAEIADAASMSTRNILRSFKSNMGISPMDYLIRFRIQRAANLLKETTSSIADISAAVGITDQNLFSRTFKRITGISPRIYRTKLSEAESAKEV